MINLFFASGKAFVWNAEDAYKLRKDHRIVGSLVGCYPIKPFQAQSKWLPLQLMNEEVKLLVDKGVACLVLSPEKITDPGLIESYYLQRNKLCEEQGLLMKENRKKEILEKADEIYEGKKRKYLKTLEKNKKAQRVEGTIASGISTEQSMSPDQDIECYDETIIENPVISCDRTEKPFQKCTSQSELGNFEENIAKTLDKTAIIEAELAKVPDVNNELSMVQLFAECPWKSNSKAVNMKFPCTKMEKLRYAVFKDLWEKNYYITSGTKFGGDFLAYEGDPLKYHALFIVVCLLEGELFQGNDLVVYGRLGHQVKKTVALASLNEDNEVDYISLCWQNEMT